MLAEFFDWDLMLNAQLPSRYRYTVTVIDRRPPLQTVHNRYRPLLTVSSAFIANLILQ